LSQRGTPDAGWSVRRLSPSNEEDFLSFLGDPDGRGWCFCVAWWLPTWDGFMDRTAEQNQELRCSLLDRGEHDGYLLYDGDATVGWCQVGPRDRLPNLLSKYELGPDPDVWAVTCFEIAPPHRGRGAARFLLQGVLADVAVRGAARVQAFPRPGRQESPGDAWTGPESMYRSAGFTEVGKGERGPVLEWSAATT
jgi:GNAT superfamily N-acetyltransferase